MEKHFSYASCIEKQLQSATICQNATAKMFFSLLLKPVEKSQNMLYLRKKLL